MIMINTNRFALNRIAAPALGLSEFFDLAASLGMEAVELRNDIRGGFVTDGIEGPKVLRMAKAAGTNGVKIITINALQQFNLPSARMKALGELESLLTLCRELECPALVLCPNNRPDDQRTAKQKYHDTIEALNTYAPLFSTAGILGYIEPLGFEISSLSSAEVALKAIGESGASCYRVLIDTFHSYLGPDKPEFFDDPSVIKKIGLVHVSGVEANIDKSAFTDAHRVLPGPKDIMKSKKLINKLELAGYKGFYSFEPFSPEIQSLEKNELAGIVRNSIQYIQEVCL
ncbi:MAG TPA: TIM barrel protein [Rectinema sp.]|jgi:2-keto-myo-inositol isomerase|nr:TIM barrel protein [Rectinema sp.]